MTNEQNKPKKGKKKIIIIVIVVIVLFIGVGSVAAGGGSSSSSTTTQATQSSTKTTSYEIYSNVTNDYEKNVVYGDGAGNTTNGVGVFLPAGTYTMKANADSVQLTFYTDYKEGGVNETLSGQNPVVIPKLETKEVTISDGEFFKVTDMKGTLTATLKQ